MRKKAFSKRILQSQYPFWMYIKSWLKIHLTWKHKVLTRKLLTFRLNLARFELNYTKFGILSPSCNYSTPNGQLLSKFRRNVVTFLPRWRKFMTSCRLWLHAWVAVKSLLSQIRTWRVVQNERGHQIGTGGLGKSVRSVLRKSEKGSNVSCRGCNAVTAFLSFARRPEEAVGGRMEAP